MAPLMPYLFLLVGLTVLTYGADRLVDASSRLALRLGVKPLIVGLTVVAFGTSAPELVVSVQSALAGSGGIAFGNVVGSNICNVALILGFSAIVCPILVSRQLFRFDIPVCIAASLLVWLFLSDGNLLIWEGVVFTALFIGYVVYCIVTGKEEEQGQGQGQGPSVVDTVSPSTTAVPTTKDSQGNTVSTIKGACAPVPKGSAVIDLLLIALGLGMLVGGAHLFVNGAVTLAKTWGVSEAVIGLTIVAVGTSLPEFATSAVAAFKKQSDIAVGNIVGSNIFNILFILGVVGLMGPASSDGIMLRDLLLMIGLAVALFVPLLTKNILGRWAGVAFLGAYVAYVVVLCREAIG